MNEQSNIKDLLKPAIRAIPLVILLCGAAGFAALQSVKYQTPLYEATSQLKIDTREFGVTNTRLFKELDVFSGNYKLETETEMLQSEYLLKEAVKTLNFGISYFRVGKIQTSEMFRKSPFTFTILHRDSLWLDKTLDITLSTSGEYTISRITKPVFRKKAQLGEVVSLPGLSFRLERSAYCLEQDRCPLKGVYQVRIRSLADQVNDLTKYEFFVKPLQEEVPVFRITARHPVPGKARKFVNAVADTYIRLHADEKSRATVMAEKFIGQQLDSVQRKLTRAENAIARFKTQNKLVNPKMETDGLLRTQQQLELQLNNMEQEMAELEQLQRYIKLNRDTEKFAPNYELVRDPLFNEKLKELNTLKRELRAQSVELESVHPEILAIKRELKQVKNYLLESIDNTTKSSQLRYYELSDELQKTNRQLSLLPGLEKELKRLERNFSLYEKKYSYLLEKKVEASIAKSARNSFHKVLSYADLPEVPVSPNKTFTFIVAVFLGGVTAILLSYGWSYLFPRIEHRGQLERQSAVPFLAAIRKKEHHYHNRFFNLYSKLNKVHDGTDSPVITFTSTISGEGKSFIARNFASFLEESGKTVIVLSIRADNTPFQRNRVGNWPEATLGAYNLTAAEELPTTLYALQKEFDYIIVDGLAVGREIAMLDIMKRADINLYCIRARYTPTPYMINPDIIRKEYNIENLFLVLNHINGSYNYEGIFSGRSFRSARMNRWKEWIGLVKRPGLLTERP